MNQWRQLENALSQHACQTFAYPFYIPLHILWRRPTAGRLTAGFGGALNSSAMDLNIWLKNEPIPISAAAFRVSKHDAST
jgi:hypothetical protein